MPRTPADPRPMLRISVSWKRMACPWREAITTRHQLSHGFDTVDLDQLWDTVKNDLPPLASALERALADLGT